MKKRPRAYVSKDAFGRWWVNYPASPGVDALLAGPYKLKRSATYVTRLVNEVLDKEPCDSLLDAQ